MGDTGATRRRTRPVAARRMPAHAANSSCATHNPDPRLVVYGSVRNNRATTGVTIQATVRVAAQTNAQTTGGASGQCSARPATLAARPVTCR